MPCAATKKIEGAFTMQGSNATGVTLSAEITAGRGIGLVEAARRFPVNSKGRPTHPSTLTRWIHQGVRRSDGVSIRLKALRVGGKYITSLTAIEAFLEALAEPVEETPAHPAPPSAAALARQAAADIEALRKLGV